jgi:flagellin-like hook-associated protein FlgL
MSTINPSLPSAYSTYLTDTQSQINLIQTQLNTGKKFISAADQSTITKLSANATGYSTATTSITNAQSVIAGAQKGLVSVTDKLNQMQLLAIQAADPSLSNLDAVELNRRFQILVSDMGKIATTAGVNGSNLLSGTAGLNVKIGPDNTPASRMFVQPVNVYGMLMMGSMSGIRLESLEDANSAIASIRSAMATVSNGQMMLSAISKQLSAKSTSINSTVSTTQTQISNLQNINKPAAQAQLQVLNNKLAVYTLLSKLG